VRATINDAWFTPPRSFKNGRSGRAPESRAYTIRELVGDQIVMQSPRPTLNVACLSVADPEAPLAVARAPRFDAVFDPWRRSKKAAADELTRNISALDVYGAQSPISQPRDTVVEISLIRETFDQWESVRSAQPPKIPKDVNFSSSGYDFFPQGFLSSRQTDVQSSEESYLVLRSCANCCCIFRGKSRSESFKVPSSSPF